MTSIDRTAYPRLNKQLSDKELSAVYELDEKNQHFIQHNARNNRGYLVLATMLKTRQQLGYFIPLEQVPHQIIAYLSSQLKIPDDSWLIDEEHFKKTLYRYRVACRKLLGSTVFSDEGRNRIITCVRKAAYTMSDPADLVNVAIEELINANIELPAFSTLDRLVSHERQAIHNELYLKITTNLTSNHRQSLEALLQITEGDRLTGFAQMKQTPGPATLKHFRVWEDRLAQLKAVLDPKPFFKDVAYTKIRQFAAEAQAYEISDMRGIRNDEKRYTLLLSLLHITQSKTRDELIDMFLKRMKRVQHTAQEKLRDLQEKHREIEESLIGVLGQVLQHANGDDANAALGKHVREILNDQGGIEVLNDQFIRVTAYHHNNYLPLLWSAHATNRAVIFRVLDLIQIKSSTQDRNLLQALEFVCQHRNTRKDSLPPDINIEFISQRWQTFVRTKNGDDTVFDRRALEVYIFIHLAEALQCGDLYVEDSGAYSDYRQQLMPWSECQKRLPDYCQSLGLPNSAHEFVDSLRLQLTTFSEQIDQKFPENSTFTIDDDGSPHLKRQEPSPLPEGSDNFKKEVYERIPERHLLDILKHVQHWSNYTKHFNPPIWSRLKDI